VIKINHARIKNQIYVRRNRGRVVYVRSINERKKLFAWIVTFLDALFVGCLEGIRIIKS